MHKTCHRTSLERPDYWLGAALLALALKQFYSVATATQLQWQLYPLVVMLELFSDLRFEMDAGYAWQDPIHRVNIVKGCAGINFLIISFLGYCGLSARHSKLLWQLAIALACAWLTALLANTVRILLCIAWQDPLAEIMDTSAEVSHRFLGVAVYFLCLWGQLAAFRLKNIRHTAIYALFLYLGITVALPLVRARWLGLENPDSGHLGLVVGMPILIVLTTLVVRGLVRKKDYCAGTAKIDLPKPS